MLNGGQISEELIINVLGREFFKMKKAPSPDVKPAYDDRESPDLLLLSTARYCYHIQ